MAARPRETRQEGRGVRLTARRVGSRRTKERGVRIHDDDRQKFEELDDQRRRIDDEFNEMVQQMRSGVVRDDEKLRIEAQHLHVRHQGIIRQMIDLLVYG
jgi:hypothetical protein